MKYHIKDKYRNPEMPADTTIEAAVVSRNNMSDVRTVMRNKLVKLHKPDDMCDKWHLKVFMPCQSYVFIPEGRVIVRIAERWQCNFPEFQSMDRDTFDKMHRLARGAV